MNQLDVNQSMYYVILLCIFRLEKDSLVSELKAGANKFDGSNANANANGDDNTQNTSRANSIKKNINNTDIVLESSDLELIEAQLLSQLNHNKNHRISNKPLSLMEQYKIQQSYMK